MRQLYETQQILSRGQIYTATTTVMVTAKLTSGGTGVPSESLTLEYRLDGTQPWTTLGSQSTGSDGSTIFSVANLTAGSLYDFQVTFAGDSNFAASNYGATYTPAGSGNPDQTSLGVDISPTTITTASTVTADITLDDSTTNMPITGTQLSVELDAQVLGMPTTDSSGMVSIQLPSLTEGNHTLTVSYAGSSTHTPAVSNSTLQVSSVAPPPPPPPGGGSPLGIILGASAIGAGAVALFLTGII